MSSLKIFHPRSDSNSDSIDSSLVQLVVSEIVTQQRFGVAPLALLVYHSIITFNDEVKYFWANPGSKVSLIYFANRYIGLLGAVCNLAAVAFTESLMSCRLLYWIASLSDLTTIVLIDYILLIRVSALYHQNKRLSVYLHALLALELVAGLAILIYCNIVSDFTAVDIATGITICNFNNNPPQTLDIVSWSIPLAYGLILLVFALYKAAGYWKLSSGFKGFHLIGVLIQDQLIYYGFVIFCCVLRMIDNSLTDASPVVSNILNAVGNPTLLCILGGQLLINLKEAGERGANGGVNYTPRNLSGIEFAR